VQPPLQVVVSAFLLQPWREVVAPSAADPTAGSQVFLAAACWPHGAMIGNLHLRSTEHEIQRTQEVPSRLSAQL
jgi:hypothetical protein